MEKTIKQAIHEVLIPYYNNLKVTETKIVYEYICIDDYSVTGLYKQAKKIAEARNIDINKISVDRNEYGEIVLEIEKTANKTEKEILKDKEKKFNCGHFYKIGEFLYNKGFIRKGFDAQDFINYFGSIDVKPFQFMKPLNINKLVAYYSFFFRLDID